MEYMTKVEEAYRNGLLTAAAVENVRLWLTAERYAPFRAEVLALIDAAAFADLNDAFYQVIPFGTAGRRGKVGVGSNRMNDITIGESAQGLAAKLKIEFPDRTASVAVAYDTRLTSERFAEKTACVLAGNGVKVYLFDGFRSTPELSFAVRQLKCDAGVVVSASHNPPQDNGFKAYWTDGGQIVPPLDRELIEEVAKVVEIKEIDVATAKAKGLLEIIGAEMDDKFIQALAAHSLSSKRGCRIAYSPLHGAGVRSVLPLLERAGFKDIRLVDSQTAPDGNFPGVPGGQPNPENASAMTAVLDLARECGADVAMASDPDADRLAVASPQKNGEWVLLTGNQTAALMIDYICARMRDKGLLRQSMQVLTTCVSSPLTPMIALSYGLTVRDDLLVGFKWVAEVIEGLSNPDDFLFGTEESIGFMKGAQTRDKDAAIAALMIAELAAELKAEGRTLFDKLEEIYKRYGYFRDWGRSVYLEGAAGKDRMRRMMARLRSETPHTMGEEKILAVTDRLTGEIQSGAGEKLGYVEGPKSDLLIFHLDRSRRSWVALRPSGTEPKIKFYYSLYEPVVNDDLASAVERAQKRLSALDAALGKAALSVE